MKRLKDLIAAAVVIGVFVLMLGLILEGFGHISDLTNDEKREAFSHHDKEFLCRGGFERFLVSKSGGWSIKKDEFIKEDKFVSISECRERE